VCLTIICILEISVIGSKNEMGGYISPSMSVIVYISNTAY